MKANKVLNIELLEAQYHKYAQKPEQYIMDQMGPQCSLNRDKVRTLVQRIGQSYHGEEQGVYYHNLTHAFDVATTTDRILIKTNLIQKLTINQDEKILYLITAYAHDVGHEGLTNNYYIKNNKNLAIIYNYASPLQNMHASKLMRLFHEIQLDVNLAMKKRLISMILSTDNVHHQQKINKLLKISPKQNLKDNQQLVLGSVLHAADIGNPVKNIQIFLKWGEHISMQFQRQKFLETHRQPEALTYNQKIQQQIYFANNFTKPFYIQLQIILPELSQYIKRIQQNLQQLISRKNNEQN